MINHIIFDWQGVISQVSGINRELLDWARSNSDHYSFSILTNCPGDFSKKLKNMGVDNLFTEVVNPENSFVRKPDPKAYEEILNKLEKDPDEVFFIDDSVTNVRAAKKMGIEAVLYKNNQLLFKQLNELKK